jgi:hypothetical protein
MFAIRASGASSFVHFPFYNSSIFEISLRKFLFCPPPATKNPKSFVGKRLVWADAVSYASDEFSQVHTLI